jgi:hypothetical protein
VEAICNDDVEAFTTTITAVKTGVLVKGLTPGTIYAFRVRALGKLGPADSTGLTTKMARSG